MKYRKAYFEIEKALKSDFYSVIMMLGLRKMGKTTILKQLAENHGGHYVNFREVADPQKVYYDLFKCDEDLILMDEIGYLENFDLLFEALENYAGTSKKRVVITGSSYGTLRQLGKEVLGGGRSHKVELFPLDFEEYLYFSGKISWYGEEYDPVEEDVENYYRLANIPTGMRFIIDKDFMVETFSDIEVARANYCYAPRDIFLTREQYVAVVDILAYTLNQHISMNRLGGAQIGKQEFLDVSGIPLSKSLISLANKLVHNMIEGSLNGLGVRGLALIITHLFCNGFLFVDLAVCENGNEEDREISDTVVHDLGIIRSLPDFEAVLSKYTFSVISPLLYTRLLVDLENIVGTLYTNPSLSGKMYELAIKAESVYRKGYDIYHDSHKYSSPDVEVDLYTNGLLLEAAVGHKKDRHHHVNKVLKRKQRIRVVTDEPGVFKDMGNYYRIGYPKALLMLSNGTIFDLKPSRVDVDTEMNKF